MSGGDKKIVKEMMAKILPNLRKTLNPQIQDAQQISTRLSTQENIPTHIIKLPQKNKINITHRATKVENTTKRRTIEKYLQSAKGK